MSGQVTRFWVVASDLDGTLLDPDGEVSVRTADVLHRVRAAGVHVVAATGRPPRWVHHLAEGLVGPRGSAVAGPDGANRHGLSWPGSAPPEALELGSETGRGPVHESELADTSAGLAICSNGALVVDLHTREVVIEHRIRVEVAAEVVRRLQDVVPEASFAVERAHQFGCDEAWLTRLRRRSETVGSGADLYVAEVSELVSEPPVKVLAWVPSAAGDSLIALATEAVGDLATVTSSGGQELIEVSALGVDKGSALAEWCADRGIDRSAVVAFGDARNDVTMLRWAGRGVATQDAHPDATAAADELCGTNDVDGVAAWLEDHLLGDSRQW